MKLKKSHLLIGAALLVVLGSAGAAGLWVLRKRRHPPLTAEQAFAKGQEYLQKRRYVDAYRHFNHAAQARPGETSYQWESARAAHALRQEGIAVRHAQNAWDAGLRNRDVLEMLVAGTPFKTPQERLKAGLAWLKELPDNGSRKELEGDLHFGSESFAESLRLWAEHLEAAPSPRMATKVALAHVALKKPEMAEETLKAAREGSRLDEQGYSLLGNLLAERDKLKEAEAAFAEGRQRFPEGRGLRLSEAVLLMTQDRLADAGGVLEPLRHLGSDPASETLHHSARLFLGFIAGARADAAALQALAAAADGDTPMMEGERLFYRTLEERNAGKPGKTEDFKRIRRLLPRHPAVEWAAARDLARSEAWAEAVDAYQGIEGLMARAPRIQFELALSLQRARKPDEALSTLRRLHGRGHYSKQSVELFRDIAFQRGLAQEGAMAQKLLEEKFRDDPGVLFAGGLLSLRSGKLDEAAAVFEALAAKLPERADVELARLSVYLARKDYEGLLRECEASKAPRAGLAPLRAEALVRLGRADEAERTYEQALGERPDPAMMLSYANLLLGRQKADGAARWYSEVLKSHPKNAVANLGLGVLALQKHALKEARARIETVTSAGAPIAYAYLLLAEIELRERQPERAVAACTRALSLAPNDLKALALQGVAHLKAGRPGEAEAILQQCIQKEPSVPALQWELAHAKLARGAPEEALKVVDAALAKGSAGELPFALLRALLLAQLGKADEAKATLAKAGPEVTPVQARLCEAWLLQREGRAAEAAGLLRPHLDDALATSAWAELMIHQGKDQGVMDALARHKLEGPRWIQLGVMARQKELNALAVGCYRKAIEHEPENALLLNNYAWASLQLEAFDPEAVLAAARKASSLLPENSAVVHTYATALLKCRKDRECIEYLERARQLTERFPKLMVLLGEAYQRAGNAAQAIKWYGACLQHPDTADVQSGDLARPALQKRLEDLKAKQGSP